MQERHGRGRRWGGGEVGGWRGMRQMRLMSWVSSNGRHALRGTSSLLPLLFSLLPLLCCLFSLLCCLFSLPYCLLSTASSLLPLCTASLSACVSCVLTYAVTRRFEDVVGYCRVRQVVASQYSQPERERERNTHTCLVLEAPLEREMPCFGGGSRANHSRILPLILSACVLVLHECVLVVLCM